MQFDTTTHIHTTHSISPTTHHTPYQPTTLHHTHTHHHSHTTLTHSSAFLPLQHSRNTHTLLALRFHITTNNTTAFTWDLLCWPCFFLVCLRTALWDWHRPHRTPLAWSHVVIPCKHKSWQVSRTVKSVIFRSLQRDCLVLDPRDYSPPRSGPGSSGCTARYHLQHDAVGVIEAQVPPTQYA